MSFYGSRIFLNDNVYNQKISQVPLLVSISYYGRRANMFVDCKKQVAELSTDLHLIYERVNLRTAL